MNARFHLPGREIAARATRTFGVEPQTSKVFQALSSLALYNVAREG